jgi:hypothetical protein
LTAPPQLLSSALNSFDFSTVSTISGATVWAGLASAGLPVTGVPADGAGVGLSVTDRCAVVGGGAIRGAMNRCHKRRIAMLMTTVSRTRLSMTPRAPRVPQRAVCGGFFYWWIEPARVKRMAASKPSQGTPASDERTMMSNTGLGVRRATRIEPAARAEQRHQHRGQ